MSHALIFGASGISGWSLLNQARVYPSPTTFARITGLTNRPYNLTQAQLPEDERIRLVSGIDLTDSIDNVVELLRVKVPNVESVTHVFFMAYIEADDFESRKKINTHILDVAIRAIEKVSSNLKTVVLQTGGKGYGLEFPNDVTIAPPLSESLPRIPEPWASNIFYYNQYDLLQSLSSGKSWTFSEIRPDGIVGFAPGSNAMNMAQGIALYLTIYKEVYGPGSTVPFPGSERGFRSTHSDTFQDILSKLEIFAALNVDKCGNGGVFNAADGDTVSWSQVWLSLCAHFGLVGSGPAANTTPMLNFVKKHRKVWTALADEHGLKESVIEEQGWVHVHFMLVQFDFNREYDLSKAREMGFEERIHTVDGYVMAWERMRRARILPPL